MGYSMAFMRTCRSNVSLMMVTIMFFCPLISISDNTFRALFHLRPDKYTFSPQAEKLKLLAKNGLILIKPNVLDMLHSLHDPYIVSPSLGSG